MFLSRLAILLANSASRREGEVQPGDVALAGSL
jgi:hypothetical protein